MAFVIKQHPKLSLNSFYRNDKKNKFAWLPPVKITVSSVLAAAGKMRNKTVPVSAIKELTV